MKLFYLSLNISIYRPWLISFGVHYSKIGLLEYIKILQFLTRWIKIVKFSGKISGEQENSIVSAKLIWSTINHNKKNFKIILYDQLKLIKKIYETFYSHYQSVKIFQIRLLEELEIDIKLYCWNFSDKILTGLPQCDKIQMI